MNYCNLVAKKMIYYHLISKKILFYNEILLFNINKSEMLLCYKQKYALFYVLKNLIF